MLYRKIGSVIEEHLQSDSDKILIVEGARQVGKSFIIREIGQRLFPNYIELNFIEDAEGPRLFENIRTVDDFYLQVSMIAGNRMGSHDDTLIFLDEIQFYPQLLTLLKFLRQDNRYTYIASGSLLGLALRKSTSIPVGSIRRLQMYPLDFEEFLLANSVGETAIDAMRSKFEASESLDETNHRFIMDLFRKYLLVGGLPDAVKAFVETSNIVKVRDIHRDIMDLYIADAVKYEKENSKKLVIAKTYRMIPSFMENKKKRVVVKEIDDKKGARFSGYAEEFEYITSSGIALEVKAITTPVFPISGSATKNLMKLYMNDVGLLTYVLYRNNIRAVLDDQLSVNLGSVYESVTAQELAASGNALYYYDTKKNGEVDYVIDDYTNLSALPIEVKSGKDYKEHSALDNFLANKDYNINRAIVFSNEREMYEEKGIIYMPIYDLMFLHSI